MIARDRTLHMIGQSGQILPRAAAQQVVFRPTFLGVVLMLHGLNRVAKRKSQSRLLRTTGSGPSTQRSLPPARPHLELRTIEEDPLDGSVRNLLAPVCDKPAVSRPLSISR